jgi:hypothetical protein
MPRLPSLLGRVLVVLAPLAFVGASCGQGALGIMPGVLNDPSNLSLRRALLAYGMSRACAEVAGRSLPIRVHDDDPAVGRFVPLGCAARDVPGHQLALQLGGRGYVWTAMSQRVGFEASATVAYETDFQLDGSTMYVYFRPRGGTPPAFLTRVVEQPTAAWFGGMATGPGGQRMTDAYGVQIMTAELARGFTVIRKPDGTAEVALGVVPPGWHPRPAIQSFDPGKAVLLTDRSELHMNQRDFVPLEVPAGASRVTVLVGVDGVPAVDVLLVPRALGEAWLTAYTTQAATTPPPGPPLLDEAVGAGMLWRRSVSVAPGGYYLVLDNTPTAGRTAPLPAERAAFVSYGVEVE